MKKSLVLFLGLFIAFAWASAKDPVVPKFQKDLGVLDTPWGQQHCFDRLLPKTTVAPQYPSSEKQSGVMGTVIVAALVGADGKVEKASIMKSSGSQALDLAASESILQWRYHPIAKDAAFKEFVTVQPLVFRVE